MRRRHKEHRGETESFGSPELRSACTWSTKHGQSRYTDIVTPSLPTSIRFDAEVVPCHALLLRQRSSFAFFIRAALPSPLPSGTWNTRSRIGQRLSKNGSTRSPSTNRRDGLLLSAIRRNW